MIQTLIHHPAVFVVALLVLVFVIDQAGLRLWISWLNRREGKAKSETAREYWRLHQ
jgi:hypothetical protein